MTFEFARFSRCLFLYLTIITCCSCEQINDEEITFIGDSLIARWDVEHFFPVYKISNMGLSGSGIEWVEANRDRFSEKSVIALTGTNDLKKLDNTDLESYAARYIDAMIGLNAKCLIIVSILPRNCESDAHDINQIISELNQMIADGFKEEKAVFYCDVYVDFLKNGSLNMNLSYDGIHLNQYGYEILAKKIKNLL